MTLAGDVNIATSLCVPSRFPCFRKSTPMTVRRSRCRRIDLGTNSVGGGTAASHSSVAEQDGGDQGESHDDPVTRTPMSSCSQRFSVVYGNSPFDPCKRFRCDVLVAVGQIRVRADVSAAQHGRQGRSSGEPEDPAIGEALSRRNIWEGIGETYVRPSQMVWDAIEVKIPPTPTR